LVREGEAELDGRFLGGELFETLLNALASPGGRHLFARAAGPGVEGLHAEQFFDELLFQAGWRAR
jgi:hypothetical protein